MRVFWREKVLLKFLVLNIAWFTGFSIVFFFYNDQGVSEVVKNTPSTVLPIGNPGEMGKPLVLPTNLSDEEKMMVDAGFQKNGFNEYISNLISVHRSLPDPRSQWCKTPSWFRVTLPQTSVIICFHNEAWSVLLRTVHSVLDRSSRDLIKEIILVDDFSNLDHLKQQLADYFVNETKVKIVRANKREGLIRARLLGASKAQGTVLTYLDSHCECNTGWLEPLLDRIARNPSTVACPVIDNINLTTLEYESTSDFYVGGFDWRLMFVWQDLPKHKRHRNPARPIRTPTMAGGLFSIDRKFFERLGTYDDGFDIWGAENLELSFKIWMCGGTLEIVPCSRVGHIARVVRPYGWGSVIKRNNVRLAEVWLDEYAKFYYETIGNDKGDYGNVKSRRELRRKLRCRSFKWYLKTIYPWQFIPTETNVSGKIRNLGYGGDTCLESPGCFSNFYKPPGLIACHSREIHQFWVFGKNGHIRRNVACLDYGGKEVILFWCRLGESNQLWDYDTSSKLIKHRSTHRCLAINEAKNQLVMEQCDSRSTGQQWSLENYDTEKL